MGLEIYLAPSGQMQEMTTYSWYDYVSEGKTPKVAKINYSVHGGIWGKETLKGAAYGGLVTTNWHVLARSKITETSLALGVEYLP